MAQLTIRRLDEELVRRLKVRAAENNRSAESEVRVILAETLLPKGTDFWARADALRGSIAMVSGEDSTASIRRARDQRTRHLAQRARNGRKHD